MLQGENKVKAKGQKLGIKVFRVITLILGGYLSIRHQQWIELGVLVFKWKQLINFMK